MKCPNCNATLLMMERNGIEIDYCPSCRGVWLDKGELDKMLQYASRNESNNNHDNENFGRPGKYDPYRNIKDDYSKPNKKRSFLGDLFDFD